MVRAPSLRCAEAGVVWAVGRAAGHRGLAQHGEQAGLQGDHSCGAQAGLELSAMPLPRPP
uniref:Rab geranylgeranyl transferase, b subunit n=1 Tax=Mus musculus TaxID=10090 RepID=A0A0G2JFP7_MOUSE